MENGRGKTEDGRYSPRAREQSDRPPGPLEPLSRAGADGGRRGRREMKESGGGGVDAT